MALNTFATAMHKLKDIKQIKLSVLKQATGHCQTSIDNVLICHTLSCWTVTNSAFHVMSVMSLEATAGRSAHHAEGKEPEEVTERLHVKVNSNFQLRGPQIAQTACPFSPNLKAKPLVINYSCNWPILKALQTIAHCPVTQC